jgi:hypothetical protein
MGASGVAVRAHELALLDLRQDPFAAVLSSEIRDVARFLEPGKVVPLHDCRVIDLSAVSAWGVALQCPKPLVEFAPFIYSWCIST